MSRQRAASHTDTKPAVDVAGQTTNLRPSRRLPSTTSDRPPPARPRSASTGLSGVHSSAFLLTPASTSTSPTSSSTPRTTFVVPKSNSIPLISPPNHHLRARVSYPESRNSYPAVPCMSPSSDDDERTDDDVIYTAWASGQAHAAKPITTAPGQLGAGETETEADEPPRRLPTARIVGSSAPIVPPSSLQQQLTPLLFEFSRLLSIVPAFIGLLYNIYHMLYPPSHPGAPQRVDYFVSALWAILTGYQCLSLTTGLLTRWRIYYAPLSTLVRLLALQSICWPATHFTLVVLEHEKRPVITWAVIATTTCCSRSVQLWVTSNLWWEPRERMARGQGGKWHRWRGGQWGGRRWDWREVGLKCMFPAGVLYFVMAWAEQLRREFSGC
ncbi:N-glycosylation protein-domain-containing protein [Schizophyllum commune]